MEQLQVSKYKLKLSYNLKEIRTQGFVEVYLFSGALKV